MKKVAIYIRVSTQEQAQEGYSIGEQKERLIAYCTAHAWVISEIYVDGGYSGSNLKRPAIQKLLTEVNKFDVLNPKLSSIYLLFLDIKQTNCINLNTLNTLK